MWCMLMIYRESKVKSNMFLVESKAVAILCMLVSLLFLGTWPAILTLLERRGRLPQHTYLDYSITNFLAAVLIAVTFGQIGGSTPSMPNFFTQLTQVLKLFFNQILRVNFWPRVAVRMSFFISYHMLLGLRYGTHVWKGYVSKCPNRKFVELF